MKETKTEEIRVRISASVKDKLALVAKEKAISFPEYIRMLLTKSVNQ